LMVVVDTSVWIRALARREPYRSELDRLLALDRVVGHELIYGELLIGDPNGRESVLEAYEQIPHAPVVPHGEVVAIVRSREVYGRGIGWIDAHLLASALVDRTPLWTADARLSAVARDLEIAYEPPRPYLIPNA